MNTLSLTTLPHYLSIYPMWNRPYYPLIVCASTTLSFLYHRYSESNEIITVCDYVFALVWASYDLRLSSRATCRLVLLLNTVIFLMNMSIAYDKNYVYYHSLWHLLSAAKSLYISHLLQRATKQPSLRV